MASLAVLGAGRIGGEIAFLSSVMGIIDELVLYDVAVPFLRAQVLDLQHACPELEISTDPVLAGDVDICVFAAGSARNPDVKTRVDLLGMNVPAIAETAAHINNFAGILITITNPMDAVNYYLHKTLGIDRTRCLGFGGQLDSARFAIELAERQIGGAPWVLGEHGEYQVPLFSRLARKVDPNEREAILAALRGSSMEVIKGKGGTVFGPAAHIVDLIDMVFEDARSLVTCSAVLEGEYGLDECSIGVPVRVGRYGIETIEEWHLDPWEQQRFSEAGTHMQTLCARLDV